MRFRLLPVRSPLLRESLLISFPGLLRWFTSSGMTPPPYFIQARGARISPCGLPHSAIRGSRDMCSSPRLFAACHGLLRPPAPRHPPWTYIRLTILSFPGTSFRSAVHLPSSFRTASLVCTGSTFFQLLVVPSLVNFKDLFFLWDRIELNY